MPAPANLLRRAALALALPAALQAAAFPRAPGSGSLVLGLSHLDAGSVSDFHGRKRGYDVMEWGISTYGEIGMSERTVLGWSWGLVKGLLSDSLDITATTDPEFSLSYFAARRGGAHFALQALGSLPLGPENPRSVPDYVYALFSPRSWTAELRPVLSWARSSLWLQGGAGARARSGGLSPQFRYHAAGGDTYGERVSLLLSFSGIVPFGTDATGNPGDKEMYFGYQAAAEYRLSRAWQVGLQFDSMFTRGQEMPLGFRTNLYGRIQW